MEPINEITIRSPHPPELDTSPFKRSIYKRRKSLVIEKHYLDEKELNGKNIDLKEVENHVSECLLVNGAFALEHSPRFDIIRKKNSILLENGSKRHDIILERNTSNTRFVKSVRKRRGSQFDEKTFNEALVNAELAIDRLVGVNQEISFIARDNKDEIKMSKKEYMLNLMIGNTSNAKNKSTKHKLSDEVSNKMLHDSLLEADSKKINEENAKARHKLDRRALIYDVFRRWKLLAIRESYIRIKSNRQKNICKYLIEKMQNRSITMIRKAFSKWYENVMASPLSFETKIISGKRVLLCDGKIVDIIG